jgi:hypothetical protein
MEFNADSERASRCSDITASSVNLTYARRYSLFALVGIAGEDDLDASDLNAGPASKLTPGPGHGPGPADKSRLNGHGTEVSARPAAGARRHDAPARRESVLGTDQSATLRDQLLGEINELTTSEESIAWARRILAPKNTLTAEDAQAVEAAFAARVVAIDHRDESDAEPTPRLNVAIDQPADTPPLAAATIDKSTLTFGEPRRYHNKAHLRFVSAQPCVICGRKPSDPRYLRFAQRRALGRKVSDEYAIPLCRSHHRALHRAGDEARWWSAAGIEPIKVARKLWRRTRLLGAQRTEAVPGADVIPGHTPTATAAGEETGPALGPQAGPIGQ